MVENLSHGLNEICRKWGLDSVTLLINGLNEAKIKIVDRTFLHDIFSRAKITLSSKSVFLN